MRDKMKLQQLLKETREEEAAELLEPYVKKFIAQKLKQAKIKKISIGKVFYYLGDILKYDR